MEDLAQKGRSPRTQEIYASVLRDFDIFLDRQTAEEKVANEKSAREFIQERAPSWAPATQALAVSALRMLGRWLKLEGQSKQAWQLRSPKVPRKIIRVFSDEDLPKLEKVIFSRSSEEQKLFYLLYGSGLRVSEALGLAWNNLDLKSAKARVLGKGRRWREVPLVPGFVKLCAAHASGSAEKIFAGIDSACVRKWVQEWGKEAGLSEQFGALNPHRLRHAIASHLIRRGGRLPHVQKLLGHKNLSTTERYTHLELEDLMRVYDASLPKKLVE